MDPIANMFSQLKNAGAASHKEAKVAYSKMNLAILEILKSRGFINSFTPVTIDTQKYPIAIKVNLKFKNAKEMAFYDLKRISRPGRRIYISAKEINQRSRGKADILISTSKGVLSGHEAHKKGLGGELIGEVL